MFQKQKLIDFEIQKYFKQVKMCRIHKKMSKRNITNNDNNNNNNNNNNNRNYK